MNRIITRASVALVALIAGGLARAECSASGCWDVYIEELYPEAAGGVWIRTSGNEMLANCQADSGVYLRLEANTPGFRDVYATLLAAQLADKKVSLRIAEGIGQCRVVYVLLNRDRW